MITYKPASMPMCRTPFTKRCLHRDELVIRSIIVNESSGSATATVRYEPADFHPESFVTSKEWNDDEMERAVEACSGFHEVTTSQLCRDVEFGVGDERYRPLITWRTREPKMRICVAVPPRGNSTLSAIGAIGFAKNARTSLWKLYQEGHYIHFADTGDEHASDFSTWLLNNIGDWTRYCPKILGGSVGMDGMYHMWEHYLTQLKRYYIELLIDCSADSINDMLGSGIHRIAVCSPSPGVPRKGVDEDTTSIEAVIALDYPVVCTADDWSCAVNAVHEICGFLGYGVALDPLLGPYNSRNIVNKPLCYSCQDKILSAGSNISRAVD